MVRDLVLKEIFDSYSVMDRNCRAFEVFQGDQSMDFMIFWTSRNAQQEAVGFETIDYDLISVQTERMDFTLTLNKGDISFEKFKQMMLDGGAKEVITLAKYES